MKLGSGVSTVRTGTLTSAALSFNYPPFLSKSHTSEQNVFHPVPIDTHTGAQFKRSEAAPGTLLGHSSCTLSSNNPAGSSIFEVCQK